MNETKSSKQTQTESLLEEVGRANKDLVALLKLLESLSDAERPQPTYTSHYVNITSYSQ